MHACMHARMHASETKPFVQKHLACAVFLRVFDQQWQMANLIGGTLLNIGS